MLLTRIDDYHDHDGDDNAVAGISIVDVELCIYNYQIKIEQVRQQDAYTTNTGGAVKATPGPIFNGNISVADWLYVCI